MLSGASCNVVIRKMNIVKNKLTLSLSLFLLESIFAFVNAQPPKNLNWQLQSQYSDEFNGASLDTNKWSCGQRGGGNIYAYNNANSVVADGYVSLWAKKENYNGKAYTATRLNTKFNIGENTYIEVRARLINKAANIHNAFWLSGQTGTKPNPMAEIDIFEWSHWAPLANTVYMAVHEWGSAVDKGHVPVEELRWNSGLDLAADFHIYGLERRAGYLRFYFDGKMIWERNCSDWPNLVSEGKHAILDIESMNGNPVDSYLPAAFKIDYFHVYTL